MVDSGSIVVRSSVSLSDIIITSALLSSSTTTPLTGQVGLISIASSAGDEGWLLLCASSGVRKAAGSRPVSCSSSRFSAVCFFVKYWKMLWEFLAASASFCCFLLTPRPAFVGLLMEAETAVALALALMVQVTAGGASLFIPTESGPHVGGFGTSLVAW